MANANNTSPAMVRSLESQSYLALLEVATDFVTHFEDYILETDDLEDDCGWLVTLRKAMLTVRICSSWAAFV